MDIRAANEQQAPYIRTVKALQRSRMHLTYATGLKDKPHGLQCRDSALVKDTKLSFVRLHEAVSRQQWSSASVISVAKGHLAACHTVHGGWVGHHHHA